ncbi:MAG: alpha/beta hydrolase [Actinobacteria bacterium]|nr:alpha/beta hydrolase [Actinomycetota bacterium]MCG2803167.1 alpha/beta hydrolase [Cellulomonas sp.]
MSVPPPPAAVLVLPGGGYQMHAAHEGEGYAQWLRSLGMAAVVLDYPLGPPAWPAAVVAARAALRDLRDALPGVPVGVIGSSAGGHLAAALCTATRLADAVPTTAVPTTAAPTADVPTAAAPTADAGDDHQRPDFAILAYPVTSFEERPHRGSVLAALGADATDAQLAAASPDRHVDARTPPTFLWATADDELVPVSHTLRYATALGAAGVPYELHVFPHGRHGLGLADADHSVGRWSGLCAQWLRTQGLLPDPHPTTSPV